MSTTVRRDPQWWDWMLERLVEVARNKPFFFTADIEQLRQERQGPSPREKRTMGALILEAQKMGICEPLDQWAPGTRANHGRPMRVWYSLIYAGTKVDKPEPGPSNDPRTYEMLKDDNDGTC